jgi:hypothetical protein
VTYQIRLKYRSKIRRGIIEFPLYFNGAKNKFADKKLFGINKIF